MSPRDEDPILPGEPTFTLRGSDPLAGFLVSIWASAHMGDGEAVAAKIKAMVDRFVPGMTGPSYEQTADAIDVALAMFAWQGKSGCAV
ncbi:hypothetical protein [Sphingomonas sp. CFBP 8760]|uniref:hypothetical protein n=1 Tax=Sphingomonas sp. CFBP 8760 TaxID=2775282 RepID=UPI0017825B01|nr:hypothetical protein [Sphingomonas sp. CFBP 8760]MBD8548035.1 hypothetical protein [Sphingomonas sp. CFBP 8760]